MKLIDKLFRRKEGLTRRQAESVFRQMGLNPVDVFPKAADALARCDLNYQGVDDLKVDIVPEGDNINLKITGTYWIQYRCGSQAEEGGIWRPSSPITRPINYQKTINVPETTGIR